MTPDDATEIVSLLVATFRPADWTAESTAAWSLLLSDLPAEQTRTVVIGLCQSEKWMPPISAIRSAVLTAGRLPAAEAWRLVQAEIGRVGYTESPRWPPAHAGLLRAAVETLGGWLALCASENQVADRAHFLKCWDQLETLEHAKAVLSPVVSRTLESLAQKWDVKHLPENVSK